MKNPWRKRMQYHFLSHTPIREMETDLGKYVCTQWSQTSPQVSWSEDQTECQEGASQFDSPSKLSPLTQSIVSNKVVKLCLLFDPLSSYWFNTSYLLKTLENINMAIIVQENLGQNGWNVVFILLFGSTQDLP